MLLIPNKLPKIPLTNTANLPTSSGIYLVIDDANRVWYVGKASNLLERHKTHEHREDFLQNNCTKICVFIWEDLEDIDEWEDYNIKHYNPPINNNLKQLPIRDLGYDKNHFLTRYGEIKEIIRTLEQEMSQLKPNIVSILEEQPEAKIKTLEFTAYITKRKIYQYSDAIKEIEELLKRKKEEEKEKGIAIISGYSIYPTVRLKR